MTSWTRRVLLSLTLVATLALAGAGQCAATTSPTVPTAQISDLRARGHQLTFVLAVGGLEAGSRVDASSILVTADGKALTARSVTQLPPGSQNSSGDPAGSGQRQAMLVLDASGSMQGDRLAAAKAAALRYALALPADVQVGLVSFSARPAALLAPTSDRAALRSALSQVTATGDTALYDAVLAGVAAFGPPNSSAQRRMLILSDGADTNSRRSLDDATDALTGSGIGVDAVGIALSGPQRAVLDEITAAGSGRVLPAESLDNLDSAFVHAAQTFNQQLKVTADVPTSLAGRHVTIHATLTAAGETVSADAGFQLPALAAAVRASGDATATSQQATGKLPLAVPVLTFLGLLGLGLLLVGPMSGPRRPVRLDDLDMYQWSDPERTAAPTIPADGQMASVALSLVDRLIRLGGSRVPIAADLERAGMRMRPQEWMLLRISAGIAMIAVITVLSGSLPIGLLLGTLLAWLGTRILLKVKASRRSAAFADQLPDVLQLIASSLRSGFSLSQALDGVVREGAQPAASEFSRALAEARLGVQLEDALDQAADRMRCQDLTLVVMAVRISRDVGGNLAEVMLTTVHTMRERAQLKRQIRALSAEGRLSGYILVALPILVGGWFALARPTYLRPLYTASAGIAMLTIAVIGVVLGSWWMSRIVKVEV